MDLVTHSMTGLLVASVAATKKDKRYAVLLTGAFAAALIDILDVWLYFVDHNIYRNYHRGCVSPEGRAALRSTTW